ncbi:MAG: LysE family translocator [Rhodovibrionaceae bacterium]|nr:LysE family translocator [Rhodovibrionaceae bacterium]
MPDLDLLLAFVWFAFVGAMTPGPNNIMLTASGTNFGFRRSLPHMAGIAVGFPVMVLAVGLGLSPLLERYDRLHDLLRAGCLVFLLYLAWKIATAAPPETVPSRRRKPKPLSFLAAAGFQWINPKAWAVATGAVAGFTVSGEPMAPQVLLLAGIFLAISALSTASWAGFGTVIGRWLTGRYRTPFNAAMALLLLLSMAPVLLAF